MITFINPNLVFQRSDVFTTGIVYMPISLACFVAAVRNQGFKCNVIDAFGEKPNQYRRNGAYGFRGLDPKEVVDRIDERTFAIVLYAGNISYHASLVEIIRAARVKFPDIPFILLENTQAVTAYSLRRIQKTFHDAKVDYIITGEGEARGVRLLKALRKQEIQETISQIDGIGHMVGEGLMYSPPRSHIGNLDSLDFPAWDLFPIDNYFRLKYAHGPLHSKRYLPMLSSRGCPYRCRFCVIPEMNQSKWRSRTAKNVVDEMQYHLTKYNVNEFHFEDVNPTVNDKRTREICEEIISRGLKISWKLASGTKVETIKNEETIQKMAEAGCRYISISPETGSPGVLKLIDKPFNLNHAVSMIKKMNQVGIRSQACFVLGYPGENDEDRQMTRNLVHRLTRVGVDEIAIFIIAPVPGASIYKEVKGYDNYSQLNFSPEWRDDYQKLNRFRVQLYREFLLMKLCYYPFKIIRQCLNFLLRRFETKMEMVPYRALHTILMMGGLRKNRGIYEDRNCNTMLQ
jgi:anaerobic magnesium-protoporphyrin IX monomethyl ester cyclase